MTTMQKTRRRSFTVSRDTLDGSTRLLEEILSQCLGYTCGDIDELDSEDREVVPFFYDDNGAATPFLATAVKYCINRWKPETKERRLCELFNSNGKTLRFCD